MTFFNLQQWSKSVQSPWLAPGSEHRPEGVYFQNRELGDHSFQNRYIDRLSDSLT